MDETAPKTLPTSATLPGVLWTKLHLPQVPAALVERRRLLARLDAGRGVMLLCAPAGFGKSALLAEACHRGWNAAWLSLDQSDNDAVRFWRHAAATLDGAYGEGSRLSELVDQAIRHGEDPVGTELATSILNGLAPEREPVVLVLDDYHVIEDEDVHESVRLLLDYAPTALRVAITTRADPPLPLAKWRAAGTLTELRAADLRFTPSEATSLLCNVTGSVITERTAEALAERTEGWAAGLQLAGLSLVSRDDADSFAESFSGSHRFVLDYLTEEVLDSQPPTVRDFLLQTSVLDRLSGSLCDAVTGRTDGQSMLEEIEQANLFLVPLDDVRGWWRYHHMFADLLRSRYRSQQPEEVISETHRRAATWHHERGEVDDTIRHALSAGDPTWAAQVIERHADELLLRSEGATLRRWFAELPRGLVDSRRLLLAQARVALYGGRVSKAEQLLDQADRSTGDPVVPFEPSLDAAASPLAMPDPMAMLLRAFVAHLRGDADEAEELAAATLKETGSDSALGLIAQLHLAAAPWLRGSAIDAEDALTENIDRWRALGDHDRAAWSAHHLGQVQRELGKLDDALDTYQDVLTLDTAHTGADAPVAGVAHVGIAQIAYLRGDLETALEQARLGIERCRDFIDTRALANGLSTLARIHQAQGDVTAASAAMAEAAQISPAGEVVDLLDPVPTERARQMLAQGDLAAAARWADKRGPTADTPLRHVDEPAHVALARILLAQGRPEDALRHLDPLAARAAADGRRGSLVEIEMLRALARAATGDSPGALQSTADAVVAAAPQGVVQVFVDEGPGMAILLATLTGTGGPTAADTDPAFLERVNRAMRERSAGESSGASQPLIVPLTDRELEVLNEMANGKPNKQIAADLYVSLNTVKKHVTHIFDKLGVTNRTAAVAQARRLGLL